MSVVTVAARRTDPAARAVRIFSNAPDLRWLRTTAPDLGTLPPLARWLVEHCPRVVAGRHHAFQYADRVYCYNGRTDAEQRLSEAGPDAQVAAERKNAALQKIYGGLVDQPCKIDWLFSVIQPDQSDEQYWCREAALMVSRGVVAVETDGQRFEVAS